ncbi:MAG: glycosyltransferase family 2 protein [Patescibacteria group bacterium]|nr:glycosyltransferase family 2 protein [Patescibacteria group bacterium]
MSVVIPAYNEEGYIADCLRSLKEQDYQGQIEIIVVDNNSTDATTRIAKEMDAVVVFESMRGVCAARQTGTLRAKGEVIISTDADTIYPAGWVRNFIDVFASDENIMAVAGPCTFSDGPWYGKLFVDSYYRFQAFIYRYFKFVLSIPGCNTAFRKTAWRGYNVNLHAAGDEIVFLKDLKMAGRVVFLPENMVYSSGRRAEKGFFYNIFVTLLWYYLFDYILGRITGKSILGAYPAIRTKPKSHKPSISPMKISD